VSASCASATGWPTFHHRRLGPKKTRLHRVAWAWIRGLRHNSRHKLRARQSLNRFPPASGPGSPENFFTPRFKLIARRVAVSIRVPSAQPKNIKFGPSPFIARGYPHFWVGSPKYFMEKIGELEPMVRQGECNQSLRAMNEKIR
jgi:hypothetical protein